jgi:predicted GH43/DUF377 family glycosyl hydrolase
MDSINIFSPTIRDDVPFIKNLNVWSKVVQIDQKSLSSYGRNFNSSLIRWKGSLYLCYRSGHYYAKCFIVKLSEDYIPEKSQEIIISHELANSGLDDPRLIVFQNKLHVVITGIADLRGNRSSNLLVCELDEDFRTVKIEYFHYNLRDQFEKNWQFFEYQNSLYSVYSISPHLILRCHHGSADYAYLSDPLMMWTGGHLRGSTPPVKINNEYYSWMHGCVDTPGRRYYNIGLYAFNAYPPFQITRITPNPILWGDPETRSSEMIMNNHAIIFPCGAIFEDGLWKLSMGIHDHYLEIREFRHFELKYQMAKVPLSFKRK